MRIPGRVRGLFWWTDFYIMWRKIRARRVLHFKINHCMEAQEIWLRILFWWLVNTFHSLDNWKFRKESPVSAIPLPIQQQQKKSWNNKSTVLEISANAIRKEREIKDVQIGKGKKAKCSGLYSWDTASLRPLRREESKGQKSLTSLSTFLWLYQGFLWGEPNWKLEGKGACEYNLYRTPHLVESKVRERMEVNLQGH